MDKEKYDLRIKVLLQSVQETVTLSSLMMDACKEDDIKEHVSLEYETQEAIVHATVVRKDGQMIVTCSMIEKNTDPKLLN